MSPRCCRLSTCWPAPPSWEQWQCASWLLFGRNRFGIVNGHHNHHSNILGLLNSSIFFLCRHLFLTTDFVPSCKDRVYPELQRLLGQQDSRVVVGRDAQWEQILARAACLRDICRERSDHHTHWRRCKVGLFKTGAWQECLIDWIHWRLNKELRKGKSSLCFFSLLNEITFILYLVC